VAGFYPAVPGVTEEVWQKAQAALARRRDRPGRVGKKVASLFGGLLWDARTRGRVQVAWQTRGSGGRKGKKRVLVAADSMEGRAPTVSFPAEVFEAAVLSLLREVRPADVVGKEPEGEAALLAAEAAAVERRMREVEEELTRAEDGGDEQAGASGGGRALARVLRALGDKHQALLRRLAAAKQKEANPLSAAWSEARTLLDVARDEEQRLRLRDLLRQLVEDVWVLVVTCPATPSHRLCAVQVNFASGTRRDYLIHYHAAGYRRPGGWWARSLATVAAPGDLDLRRPEDAQALEADLAKLDVARLDD
jgi:hypothetical protein